MLTVWSLVLLALVLYVCRSWPALCYAFINARRVAADRAASGIADTTSTVPICILFPLYDEADIVDTLHSNLVALCEQLPPNVMLYILTSERRTRRGDQDTTRRELDRHQWPSQVRLVHMPYACIGKGRVLNEFLAMNPGLHAHTWLGIYDADSVPESGIFGYINSVDPTFTIIQQPSIYLQNYGDMGTIQKALAVYQTIWSLGSETRRIRDYCRRRDAGRTPLLFPYLYLVGHGLFIRYGTVKRLGFFPDIYEDLRIGIPAILASERIGVAPFFDSCRFARSLGAFVRQSMRWCNGAWFIWPDMWPPTQRCGKWKSSHALGLTLRGTVNNLLWATEGVLICVALMVALCYRQWYVVHALFLIVFCCDAVVARIIQGRYSAISKIVPRPQGNLVWATLLYCVSRPLFYSLGPLLATLLFAFTLKPNSTWASESAPKGGR